LKYHEQANTLLREIYASLCVVRLLKQVSIDMDDRGLDLFGLYEKHSSPTCVSAPQASFKNKYNSVVSLPMGKFSQEQLKVKTTYTI
jgi:hypothetical protein